MCRPQKEPLRRLRAQEHHELERLTHSQREPAVQVARTRALLAVAARASFTAAAHRSGDGVAKLVGRFNVLGLAGVAGRPLLGRVPTYDEPARECILAEARPGPRPARDGTAT